ncbi:hypothetical protein ACFV2X_11375 [Streptomyces sp. NPDC059679]|uniref:hypothetical protein n=1 Tax=Streptomyces sp. NPDC059679 TaxID=3346903 RepID=UPI003684B505
MKASLRPKIADRLAEAEHRAAELRTFTASLHAALKHLDALPDRGAPCDPQCGFLTAPAPTESQVNMVTASSCRGVDQEAERWRSAAVACVLSGEGMAERTSAWHEALNSADRAAIPDGLRLTLPVEQVPVVAELAAAEQQCCPFFDFRLHLDGPHLHLEVRASADGFGLLAELFGPGS